MLKSWRFWLGIIISIVSLVLAFQGIDPGKVWASLARFNWWWFLPTYLTFALSYAGRVYRWRLLFTPVRVHARQVWSALSIGYFLSGILPARIGDVVRAYLLSLHENVGIGRALSSVILERLTDGLSVVVLLAILLPLVPNIPNDARLGGLATAVLGILAILILWAIAWQRERGLAFLRRLASPFKFLQNEKLWRFVESIIDGLGILHDGRALLRLVWWCVVIWFFSALQNWSIMLGLNMGLGLDAATLILVVTALVVIVPSSPGYIGVFHYVTQLTLVQVYGADPNTALAYAFILHAFVYVHLVAMGLIFMLNEGLSFSKLQNIQSNASS